MEISAYDSYVAQTATPEAVRSESNPPAAEEPESIPAEAAPTQAQEDGRGYLVNTYV